MLATSKLWIVSPVLRDAESYRRLRQEINAVLDQASDWTDIPREFIVVDDSGADDPPTQALATLPFTRVVAPPFNLGHQRAIVFGLRAVRAELQPDDYVVTLDADGEDKPADVVRLLAAARDSAGERQLVVLGRRTSRNESLKFRLMYKAFKLFFRALTGTTVATGNFAVQRGYFVKNTIGHPTFDLCFSTSLIAQRRPVVFVPCARGSRYAGESRMSTLGLAAHGIRMMLPFAEMLAVRLLTISVAAFSLAAVGGFAAAGTALTTSLPVAPAGIVVALALLIGTVTFVGFLTIFAGFAQSSAMGLYGLDTEGRGSPHSFEETDCD